MATLRLEDGLDARTLVIGARLSIQDAGELKEIFLEAFRNTDHLIIDTTDAESIDLACAQLICAAHRTFQKADKVLELSQPAAAGMLTSLDDMAIDPACCAAGLSGTCVWKKGA